MGTSFDFVTGMVDTKPNLKREDMILQAFVFVFGFKKKTGQQILNQLCQLKSRNLHSINLKSHLKSLLNLQTAIH